MNKLSYSIVLICEQTQAFETLEHMMKCCDFVISGCEDWPKSYIKFDGKRGLFIVNIENRLEDSAATLQDAIRMFAEMTDH